MLLTAAAAGSSCRWGLPHFGTSADERGPQRTDVLGAGATAAAYEAGAGGAPDTGALAQSEGSDGPRHTTSMRAPSSWARNGHPQVHNVGGGGRPGLEAVWDELLSAGQVVYGIAVDDAHHFQGEFGPERSNPGRGWIGVRARRLEPAALMEALEGRWQRDGNDATPLTYHLVHKVQRFHGLRGLFADLTEKRTGS